MIVNITKILARIQQLESLILPMKEFLHSFMKENRDMENDQRRDLINDQVRSWLNDFTHEMLLFTQGDLQIENRLFISRDFITIK